jgi:hypothetical protein
MKRGGKIRARFIGTGKPTAVDQITNFVKDCNFQLPLFTLIRKAPHIIETLEVTFKHRVRVVAVEGVLPFYTPLVDKTIGQQFKAWAKNPDQPSQAPAVDEEAGYRRDI